MAFLATSTGTPQLSSTGDGLRAGAGHPMGLSSPCFQGGRVWCPPGGSHRPLPRRGLPPPRSLTGLVLRGAAQPLLRLGAGLLRQGGCGPWSVVCGLPQPRPPSSEGPCSSGPSPALSRAQAASSGSPPTCRPPHPRKKAEPLPFLPPGCSQGLSPHSGPSCFCLLLAGGAIRTQICSRLS